MVPLAVEAVERGAVRPMALMSAKSPASRFRTCWRETVPMAVGWREQILQGPQQLHRRTEGGWRRDRRRAADHHLDDGGSPPLADRHECPFRAKGSPVVNVPKSNVAWAGQSGFGLFGPSVTIGHHILCADVPGACSGLVMAGLGGTPMISRKVIGGKKIRLGRDAPPARGMPIDPALAIVKSNSSVRSRRSSVTGCRKTVRC